MPTKNLMAAIWSVDTTIVQRATLEQRKVALNAAIDATYAQLALYQVFDEQPYGIFVAPEYLFARPAKKNGHTAGDIRHIEENEKEALITWLKEKSKACPGLIIVPGTVAWRKPLVRPQAAIPKIGDIQVPKPISRESKANSAVKQYANDFFGGSLSANLSGPLGAKQAPTSDEKLWSLAFADSPFSTVTYMARNTAYVLLNGDVLLKYNKRGDFHEVLESGNTLYIPGLYTGRFSVPSGIPGAREIRFGIEICLDHAFATLEKTVPDKGSVDIHIITSAWVNLKASTPTIEHGGYIIHASSNKAQSQVTQDINPFIQDLKPKTKYAAQTIGNFEVAYCSLSLSL